MEGVVLSKNMEGQQIEITSEACKSVKKRLLFLALL